MMFLWKLIQNNILRLNILGHNIKKTINYEICNKESELSMTWGEYIEQTVRRINDTHAKKWLLHMCQNNETEFTPTQLKDGLKLMTEFRSKKKWFQLSSYFDSVSDNAMLNIIHAASRFFIQRSDGKSMEIDVIAESDCGQWYCAGHTCQWIWELFLYTNKIFRCALYRGYAIP